MPKFIRLDLLVPLQDNSHRSHDGNLQGNDDNDEFGSQTALDRLKGSQGQLWSYTPKLWMRAEAAYPG